MKNKILILGKVPPPYMGTSIWFESLKNSHLNDEFNIRWFNINTHKSFKTLGTINFKKVLPNLILYLKFRKLLIDFKPDLVLIPISQESLGFIKDSIFIILAKKRSKITIILHGSNLHNWLDNSSLWINKYFTNSMKNVSSAIVLGNNLRYLFKPWFKKENIYVVSNGLNINTHTINDNIKNKFIVRYLANLSSAKGILDVIKSIELLKDENFDLELRVNGVWLNKSLQDACLEMVSRLNLPVVFEGQALSGDKYRALMNSDLFVFPPVQPEGHPLVIIEAMAAGLPIITTDQGAIIESVTDGVNGFIVMPERPDQIAQKIKFLIQHPDIKIKMGHESRRLYEENFTEEKMVDNISKVFKSVLSQR